MDHRLADRLINDLEKLKNEAGKKEVKYLNVEQLSRIIKRLASFSENCEECKKQIEDLQTHMKKLIEKQGQFEKQDMKEHGLVINRLTAHLQKEHKLVSEGYYMSIYMSLGMSIGVVFGLLIFENLALGMPIGMVLGIAIGSGLDADAKKKGRTI